MANVLTAQFEAAWLEFRESVARLGSAGLERETAFGWTAKAMLGHIGFWDECVEPVVIGILRGDAARMGGWKFASGFVAPSDGSWPHEDEHNAREAAWATSQSVDVVLGRLDTAHVGALAALETFTDDELVDVRFVDYVNSCVNHYASHRAELDALAP